MSGDYGTQLQHQRTLYLICNRDSINELILPFSVAMYDYEIWTAKQAAAAAAKSLQSYPTLC